MLLSRFKQIRQELITTEGARLQWEMREG